MSFAILLSLAALSVLQGVASVAVPAGPVAAAWYAGFHANKGFPISAIRWDKYNTLIYSFAITNPDGSISLDGSEPDLLPTFVQEAHEHGVRAHIAIGGWTGSRFFSSSVATPENRTAFVQTITEFATDYDLDGINFDWEFPNHQGIGCNTIDDNDTENFLYFLQELRNDPVGAELTLTAATSITPFRGANGDPSMDMSDFADVLDYVAIFDYDIWGPWSPTVGPNGPLSDTCADPANQGGSAVSGVKAWTDAGMPLAKIVLGVPAYGRSYNVTPENAFVDGSKTELAPYPKFDASSQPLGDAWDDTGSVDVCGNYEGPGGTFRLWGLVDGGFLTEYGTPELGIYYRYDDCSQTPYVYNETSQVMVSFDNARSFAAKGQYIRDTGLRGFSMWEAGGDYHDILINSIRVNTGFLLVQTPR